MFQAAMRPALLVVMVVLLDGCVPIPHTSVRLPAFGGTILDERTHTPIVGAKVFLSAHPEVSCKSNSSGYFWFKEIDNWHYGYSLKPFGESDSLPPGEQWAWDITVSHKNYVPQQIRLYAESDHVVLLKKLGEPSEPHPWMIFNGNGEILKDMGAGRYLKPGDIHTTAHYNNRKDTEPSAIHIGFVQRVYDPQLTLVNSSDKASVELPEPKGLDWEFRVMYSWGSPVKDSSREYRLEFVP